MEAPVLVLEKDLREDGSAAFVGGTEVGDNTEGFVLGSSENALLEGARLSLGTWVGAKDSEGAGQ